MNLCNCLQCNTNNCPAAKEFNDLQKQSNAQLDELRRINEALGTNEGHSSVTHIEILKGENAALREQIKQVEAGYATRNDEVTGLIGMNAELREQLAALRLDASSKWAFLEWRDRAEKAEAENAALRGLLGRAAVAVKWGINDEYDQHAKGAAAVLLQEINAALKEEGK